VRALRLVTAYIIHSLKSVRLHGIHSPFVFQLYNQVLCHKGSFYAFGAIEKLRRKLLADCRKISVTDFGAGSLVNNSPKKSISQLARLAAKPPHLAQFLFRLVNFQQPGTILEIGTSLGLTTAYLASANKQAQVITMEGCPATAQVARSNFKHLSLKNIQLVTGNFEDTLPDLINTTQKLDFVFFDGNHRYEPTLRYFEWCLARRTPESIFVLDDIYWSEEMTRAWRAVCARPEVMISIDLFYFGLVLFREKQPKQHFTIKL
jgi:predicted O-methyltransferase YrrM